MSRYTGYGSARFAGSSSCTRRSCVMLLLCTRRVVAAQNVLAQFVELACDDGSPDLVDQTDHEALVVDRAQRRGQHLLGLEQVADVRAGVVRAGIAVALGVERREVTLVAGAGGVVSARRRVDGGIAGHPRRGDAVE